ncbi:hypothetical protein LSAT2_013632 [Lamellibrachia satsuma]|nr:hypothetical protein LSAT2_013632 [Lamellibrachia satsuma]
MLVPTIADAISVAIYVRHGTKVDVKKVLRQAMRGRSNIGVYLVHESGLWTTPSQNTSSRMISISCLRPNCIEILEHYLSHGTGVNTENQALIVPAFEQVRESAITIPENKPALLEMWEEKAIKPFHFRIVDGVEKETGAQGQTNFPRWKNADKPYTVRYMLMLLRIS